MNTLVIKSDRSPKERDTAAAQGKIWAQFKCVSIQDMLRKVITQISFLTLLFSQSINTFSDIYQEAFNNLPYTIDSQIKTELIFQEQEELGKQRTF